MHCDDGSTNITTMSDIEKNRLQFAQIRPRVHETQPEAQGQPGVGAGSKTEYGDRCAAPARVGNDQPTADDSLRFSPYVAALGDVLTTTATPLTVGVFGSWGVGKSSLLLMLEDEIKKTVKSPGGEVAASPRIIRFNAWQYSQEDAIWRALLSRVIEEFKPKSCSKDDNVDKLPPEQKDELSEDDQRHLHNLEDMQAALYRDVDREEVGDFTFDWSEMAKGGLKGAMKLGLSYVPGLSLLADLKSTSEGMTQNWAEDVLGAFGRERGRIHVDRLTFLEQFRDKFEGLIRETLGANERLYIFIDDLDRCLPEKAVEVLEAVKLFLDVERTVFVIAVDQNVITEGIRVKYSDFALSEKSDASIGRLPIRGEEYLEKIIQLPFRLPPVRPEDIVGYIEKHWEMPIGCAQVLSLGIESNPRKIKRTLNLFLFLSRLTMVKLSDQEQAEEENLGVITPVRLAKVTSIQSRYPEFHEAWQKVPLLLRDLERHFQEKKKEKSKSKEARAFTRTPDGDSPAGDKSSLEASRGSSAQPKTESTQSPLVEQWARREGLKEMLLYDLGTNEDGTPDLSGSFRELDLRELEVFIYLTGTTTSDTKQEHPDVESSIFDELLSGDSTRIESACAGLAEGQKNELQPQLMRIMETDQDANRRVSAGLALDWVGDPRFDPVNFYLPSSPDLGFVAIPEDVFEIGSVDDDQADNDEKPHASIKLHEFLIGRYPVTTAQFKAFAEKTGYDPSNNDSINGPYNLPVAYVTWVDAMKYCEWLNELIKSGDQGPEQLRGLLKKGYVIALPSEAEWERAARHTDGRLYPWGKKFSPDLANTSETGIGSRSSVGTFPGGKSIAGVLDMSGNVWEWTRSEWKAYPYALEADLPKRMSIESSTTRVLRGGSFDLDARFARCAARHGSYPNFVFNNFGFRVVASPFSGT